MSTAVNYYDIDNARKIYNFKNLGNFEKIELIVEGNFSKVIKVKKIKSGNESEGYSNIYSIKITKKFKMKETNKKKTTNNSEKVLKSGEKSLL